MGAHTVDEFCRRQIADLSALADRGSFDVHGIFLNIAQGLFIGVGAGVTTAGILGARRWWIRRKERREQIPYIRDFVETQFERILSATDQPPSAPSQEPVPADRLRYTFFRELQSVLPVVFSSRATALSYQEIFSLQRILADMNRAITDMHLYERGILPLSIAECFYEKLTALTWLGLPERDG